MEPMRPSVVPKVRALECPNCGGPVELRSYGNAISAVCPQCLTVLDTATPELKIIQTFQEKQRYTPLIPLGSRGKMSGTDWEAIGFQVRQILVEGIPYRWEEYLLYNPFKGYCYLTEYEGHWNTIRVLRALPFRTMDGKRNAVLYGGQKYKHFQTARAETIFVLGEFPWQVRVGDKVQVEDYIAPPRVLSSERTADEVTWSAGTYTTPAEIQQAFRPPGKMPAQRGIYSNQPSPYKGKVGSAWKTAGILALLLVLLAIGLAIATHGRQVFAQKYYFDTRPNSEPSFVTPVFEIPKHSNVEVSVSTDLDNDWAFFAMALIDEDTGVAYDFGKEISYYYGRDSDGSWSEGNRTGRTIIPSVSPGRYYLRVEPGMDDNGGLHRVNYTIKVESGAMQGYWLVIAFALLPLPALWTSWKAVSFENARWSESDYGPIFKTSSSGDDD
jgi:hypothetical protein